MEPFVTDKREIRIAHGASSYIADTVPEWNNDIGRQNEPRQRVCIVHNQLQNTIMLSGSINNVQWQYIITPDGQGTGYLPDEVKHNIRFFTAPGGVHYIAPLRMDLGERCEPLTS